MKLNRREFLVGGALAGTVVAHQNIKRYQFPEYEIGIPNLPSDLENFTVVHISDTHFDVGSRIVETITEVMEALQQRLAPVNNGVVVLTGDFISSDRDQPNLKILRDSLKSLEVLKFKKYAVLGNHDHASNVVGISQALKDHDIERLDEPFSVVSLPVKSAMVKIIGAPDFLKERAYYDDGSAPEFVEKAADASLNLLLTHNAEGLDPLLKDLSKTVLMAGHTHGGQFDLPFVRRLAMESIGYKSKLIAGLYQINDSVFACISRGIGSSHRLPFRLNCLPEIPLLTFKKA